MDSSGNLFGLIFAIAIVGFIVVGVIGYFNWKREKARQAAFASFASSKGWTYQVPGNQRWMNSFSFGPFGTGHNMRVEDSVSRCLCYPVRGVVPSVRQL
jgi:hypothetical protein